MNKHLKSIGPAVKSLSWIDWAMIIFFASRFFTYIFTLFLGSLGIFLTMGILAFLYLMALIKAWRNKERDGILTFFLMVFVVTFLALFTMTFNPEAKEWMLRFDFGLLTRTFDPRKGIFAAFVIILVRNRQRIFKNLNISAWLSFIYLSIHSILYLIVGSWQYYYVLEDERAESFNYNMSFGYEMVFVSILFLALALHTKHKRYWVMGILSGVLAFVFGSRGIVLPLAGFFFILIVMKIWKNRSKWMKFRLKPWQIASILLVIVAIATFILVNMDFKEVGAWRTGSFRTGIRNIDMLLNSNFAFDSGRIELLEVVGDAIRDKFPLGYGVYGDRPFLGTFSPWGYSHNVVFEMVVSFGIFGVALVIFLAYLCIKYLFNRKYKDYSILVLLFLAMCSKLFISDSFWYYDYFWALVGVFIVIQLDKAKDRKEKRFKDIAIGNKSFRPITILLAIVILANVAAAGFVLYDSVESQVNTTVRFNEPTVILAFQDMNEGSLFLGINELNRRGIPASVFVDTDEYSEEEIDNLRSYENVDLQLGLENRPLDKENMDQLGAYLDRSKEVLDQPVAVSTLEGYIHPETLQFLRSETDSLLLRTRPYGEYYYRNVTQNNLYKLVTLNSSINNYSYNGRMPFILNEHITKAYDNDAVIIIYFRDMGFIHDFIQNGDGHTEFSHFIEVVNELEDNDFNFITMTDLMEEAYIAPEERTLKNLLVNSDVIQRVLSLIN